MNIFKTNKTDLTPLLMDKQMLLKKIKTPPPHKKNLNCFCQRTSGTFDFAANAQANRGAKAKEPLFPTHRLNTYISFLIKFQTLMN
jgi:hypothetical protein